MMAHQHIFLTGFMGSGKSTLGKKLAQLLRRNFIDLDKYIESVNKQSIAGIFNQQGEEAFRKIESQCLHELLETNDKSIIALGGGTVCFYDNLQKIKQKGLLIYIQLPPKVLTERIKQSKNKRPLLQGLNNEELFKTIEDKLLARTTFYEQAHLIVNGLNLTAQILQHNIIEFQKKNNS